MDQEPKSDQQLNVTLGTGGNLKEMFILLVGNWKNFLYFSVIPEDMAKRNQTIVKRHKETTNHAYRFWTISTMMVWNGTMLLVIISNHSFAKIPTNYWTSFDRVMQVFVSKSPQTHLRVKPTIISVKRSREIEIFGVFFNKMKELSKFSKAISERKNENFDI